MRLRRLRACAAAINLTTLIHHSHIHRKWVNALDSGICERWTAWQNFASQQPDLSNGWMFQGNVAFPNASEVDWDHINVPVPDLDEVRKGLLEVGEQLKASFSEILQA
jgi:hypothetical protein